MIMSRLFLKLKGFFVYHQIALNQKLLPFQNTGFQHFQQFYWQFYKCCCQRTVLQNVTFSNESQTINTYMETETNLLEFVKNFNAFTFFEPAAMIK